MIRLVSVKFIFNFCETSYFLRNNAHDSCTWLLHMTTCLVLQYLTLVLEKHQFYRWAVSSIPQSGQNAAVFATIRAFISVIAVRNPSSSIPINNGQLKQNSAVYSYGSTISIGLWTNARKTPILMWRKPAKPNQRNGKFIRIPSPTCQWPIKFLVLPIGT